MPLQLLNLGIIIPRLVSRTFTRTPRGRLLFVSSLLFYSERPYKTLPN
jgi:hypothetical protein